MRTQLALYVLTNANSWTDKDRLDSAVTMLLMVGGGDLARAGYRGLEKGAYRIDSSLFSDLYSMCPPQLKHELTRSVAMRGLEPAAFRSIFLDAYRSELPPGQRAELALALETFLDVHPDQGGEFRTIIVELLRSRQEELSLRGLQMAGFIDDLAETDLALMKRKLLGKRSSLRMNALNGFCGLLKRSRNIRPEVLAYCASEEMKALYSRLHRKDPERPVRICAYYVLKALRELSTREGNRSPRRPAGHGARGG